MRNLFSILFVAIAAMCSMTSCSNSDDITANEPQVIAKNDLIQQLQNVNDSIFSTVTRTKKWGDLTRGQQNEIVYQDAIGAYVGGKFGAKWGAKFGSLCGHTVTGAIFWRTRIWYRSRSISIMEMLEHLRRNACK